ncbi:glycosyltransferase family 2 protein [Methyloversatilis sp. XJ19-49]|uniref:glycosyltransferase family 2 protein n=1 Tax=Methyloversatilis sp. XJ19-49 TaxID=2963429 RepID=UPI00211B8604|nr:glycosyltransferase family 2 protein [Methyloversatilis sp. XJ19-49]MCQ9376819.1 glycosyltransferase family 2 protein [Methyloversatilis sp. XJ19-49]
MARIMIGIPTRNRPDMVRDAVLSVQRQTMDDFVLVVSENPTRPEISADISAWIASLGDPRIRYVLQPIDGGEYGQARALFAQCDAPFFCMLHDDDMMDADYIEAALNVLEAHDDIAMFGGSQYLIDREGTKQDALTEDYTRYQGRDRFAEGRMDSFLEPLLQHGLFSISGAVFRSSVVAETGVGDPDMGGIYPFEFNMFLRVAERGFAAWYSPVKRIAYRWHDTSMRHSDGSILTRYMVEALVELLERRRFEGRAEQLRRRLLAYNRRNLGYILLVAGERDAALRSLRRAIGLHPSGLGLWAWWLRAQFRPRQVASTWAPKVNLTPPQPSWQEAIPHSAG